MRISIAGVTIGLTDDATHVTLGLAEPLISVVVPTYQEALNLPYLIPAISVAMRNAGLNYEIIIVDDNSQDGSEQAVIDLQRQGHPVRMIVRKDARGLSSAVLEGFRHARGEFLVCMDADLSHPPDRIPALIESLRDSGVNFVIGSRYVLGGEIPHDWSLFRRLNSRIATLVARPITRVKDPMSGFFALHRSTLNRATGLSPIGYKVGLELIVKCGCSNIREVPTQFVDRKYGQTKLNLSEQLNYLRHVKRLLDFKYGNLSRLLQFCLVGGIGVFVDLLTLHVLLLALPLKISRAVAIGVAMTSNFWLNRRLTFSDSRRTNWVRQYARFVLCCSIGGAINWSASVGLVGHVTFFRAHVTLAALIGILSGTVSNFLMSRYWAFGLKR